MPADLAKSVNKVMREIDPQVQAYTSMHNMRCRYKTGDDTLSYPDFSEMVPAQSDMSLTHEVLYKLIDLSAVLTCVAGKKGRGGRGAWMMVQGRAELLAAKIKKTRCYLESYGEVPNDGPGGAGGELRAKRGATAPAPPSRPRPLAGGAQCDLSSPARACPYESALREAARGHGSESDRSVAVAGLLDGWREGTIALKTREPA